MGCSLQTLSGILSDCLSSMGGIRKVWICHYDKVSGKPTLDSSSNKITGITLVTGSGSTALEKFHPYNFRKNTGSMTSTYTIDPANGTNFVQTDLSLVFTKQETAKRIEVAALALDELAIIVLDANGTYWYLGYDEPVIASAAGAESGTQRADGNKYTISLQDTSLSLPYEILVGTSGVDLSTICEEG